MTLQPTAIDAVEDGAFTEYTIYATLSHRFKLAETGGGAAVAGPAGESLPPAAGQVPVPAWSTPGTGKGAGTGVKY